MKNYWNKEYWNKHLSVKTNEPDFLRNLWLENYNYIFEEMKIGKALDLGCGLGEYTDYLNKKGFDVLSTDISKEVLKELKNRYPEANTLELDMIDPLPFINNSFDLIIANLSIHYFDYNTTVDLLTEIKRILKDTGYFIGSVNSNKNYNLNNYVKIEPNYYKKEDRYI